MASPITQAGGVTGQSQFAPLHTNRFVTGLWTNRNQLGGSASIPLMYEQFYSASRFDSLIGGLNLELSTKMTLGRRPGFSVYNSQSFPAINRFYSFREFSTATETIRVMADSVASVYDATGPDRKLNIWDKSPGAGDTTFQSVGNNLFFGNGVDQKKWAQKEPQWAANTNFNVGQFIVDSNNNLQVAEGGIVVGIASVAVAGNVLTLTLDPNDPNLPTNLMSLVGLQLTLSGVVNATFLNGQTITIATVPQGVPAYKSNILTAAFAHADYGPVVDSGAANSGSGISGGAAPSWSTSIGAYTYDGGVQWICKGSSVQNWGIAPPTVAPTVAQAALPTTYPAWSPRTYYSTCYLIYDDANFIHLATTFGITGSSQPDFVDVAGSTTADGSVVWTCQGSGAYASSTAYASGSFVLATNAAGVLCFYKALTDGATAAAPPVFPTPLNAQVRDGGVTWEMVGIAAKWSSVTSSSIIGTFGTIPVQGGGFVAIGTGQGLASGTAIALPTGYAATRMLGWASIGAGFSGSDLVVSGVYNSNVIGGIANSFFTAQFGGAAAFPTSTNWAAMTWTDGAAVTITASAGFQYASFTTENGDQICICVGTLANGQTVPTAPAGFSAANQINLCGMSSTDSAANIMQGIQTCTLDASLKLTTLYTDNDGNTWTGSANVMVVYFSPGGGITVEAVTSGIALVIPTINGQSISLIQATISDGASFGLPSGFENATVFATTAMSGWTSAGGNHGHGYSCTVAGLTGSYIYRDNSGNSWTGDGNVLAVAVVPNTTTVVGSQKVVDGNSNVQQIVVSGVSSATAPTWQTLQGATTLDYQASWINTGITTAARTQPSQWAYAYKTTATNHTSTASSLSAPIIMAANNYAFLQAPGSPDTQADIVVIYRYAQGGATLLYMDEIPAPPQGQMWNYTDQLPDSALNDLLPAAIASSNNPPPIGFKPLAYHLGRIWGAVGNVLSWSNPTNQTGDPNQSFSPSNFFTFPAKVIYAWPCTLGLIVFTVSDIYIVYGSGTSASPLFPDMYIPGVGLLNYDAFTFNKTTPYLMNSTGSVLALDPSSGIIEPGFPIADQILAQCNPATARLAWHEGGTFDTALFVGDAASSWYRMSSLSAPEQGLVWSPKGTLGIGYKALASVEVSPGQKRLLAGPSYNGPILQRDLTVTNDNGALYPMWSMIGSIVLAQPGQVAELAFMTLESAKVGTNPTIAVMLGEINGPDHPELFDQLYRTRQDPPLLPPAETLYNDRFDIMQNQKTVWCRHLQIRFDWTAEDIPNELLTYTIFGALHNETEAR
jgi:hypothetical protein